LLLNRSCRGISALYGLYSQHSEDHSAEEKSGTERAQTWKSRIGGRRGKEIFNQLVLDMWADSDPPED